jgi:histidinol-phosphate phosphatase family protein
LAGKRAVFLDRDDTIMEDVVYCKDPEDVRLLPGAAQGIRALADAGFLIVIATNQSGLGRGYFTEEELKAVHERLRDKLRAQGADFDALYYCPHRPEEGCDCRKPSPGLLLRAANDLGIDMNASYCIGDRKWDLEAGRAVGAKTVLITTGKLREVLGIQPDHVACDLQEAARLIRASQALPMEARE